MSQPRKKPGAAEPPQGLPPVKTDEAPQLTGLDKARFCPDCGKEARILAGEFGSHAFCGPCKKDWPIGGPIPQSNFGMSIPRGTHKITLVDPDISKLYD